jgi:hypothetical protein
MLLTIVEQSTKFRQPAPHCGQPAADGRGRAEFPGVLTTASGTQSTIFAMSPDFVSGRTWQSNIAYERALGTNYSGSIGFMYAKGDSMPVINENNLINPVRTLEDGRGVYSAAVNATTRRDPRYNRVRMVESIGESWYKR